MDPAAAKQQFRRLLRHVDDAGTMEELCLLMGILAGDEIDITSERLHHDEIAASITPTFSGIVTALFGEHGYRGNVADYYSIDNSLLNRVRRDRRGLPITLCVQALTYAERLAVPMVGVGMPGHFILRCGTDPELFADPFHGTATFDRADARRLFERMTGSTQHWQDAYLNPVGPRDIVYRMLNNMRVATAKHPRDRLHLPWILELSSWFPQGAAYDSVAVAKTMAPFN